jgi:hypothetical protein
MKETKVGFQKLFHQMHTTLKILHTWIRCALLELLAIQIIISTIQYLQSLTLSK